MMTTATVYKLVPADFALSCDTSTPPENTVNDVDLYLLRHGHRWMDTCELRNDLFIQTTQSEGQFIATTSYLALEEYGVGDTLDAAICDLLTSLWDYRQSLEDLEPTLSQSAADDLKELKDLIKALNQ